IRDLVVFCKASFLLVTDLESIADRFLPFRAVTVCVQQLPDLPSTHRSAVTFLVRFNPADSIVEGDNDEKILVKISLCRRGTGCRFPIPLPSLRLGFADSCKRGGATQD